MGSTAPFMVIDTDMRSKRDLIEENLHVENGIDGHARFAHVSRHALVIGVVAAMRGEIEGDRKTVLSGGQVAAIKRV